MRTYRLMGRGRSLVIRSWGRCPRRNTSSAFRVEVKWFDHPSRTKQWAIMLERINTREG